MYLLFAPIKSNREILIHFLLKLVFDEKMLPRVCIEVLSMVDCSKQD